MCEYLLSFLRHSAAICTQLDKNRAFITEGEMRGKEDASEERWWGWGREGEEEGKPGQEKRTGEDVLFWFAMKCKNLHQKCNFIVILDSSERIH